jgi:hypothetical protein
MNCYSFITIELRVGYTCRKAASIRMPDLPLAPSLSFLFKDKIFSEFLQCRIHLLLLEFLPLHECVFPPVGTDDHEPHALQATCSNHPRVSVLMEILSG